jgi:hypothetical protein
MFALLETLLECLVCSGLVNNIASTLVETVLFGFRGRPKSIFLISAETVTECLQLFSAVTETYAESRRISFSRNRNRNRTYCSCTFLSRPKPIVLSHYSQNQNRLTALLAFFLIS